MTHKDDEAGRQSRRQFLHGMFAVSALAAATSALSARAAETSGSATTSPATGLTDDLTTTAAGSPEKAPESAVHRVISANILMASSAHEGTPMAWSVRRDLCMKVLRAHNPDLICMQEVLRPQAEDFARLFDDYEQFGFPGPYMDANPTDYHGVTKNVILWRKDRYDMTAGGQYWLSETPLIAASQSWDSMRPRSATWVRLRDKKTGKQFRLLDTHFDHKSQVGRENQARVIVEEAGQYKGKFPQVLCGDLNGDRNNLAVRAFEKAGWRNSYSEVHSGKDPGFSFHGMKGIGYNPKKKRGQIDYILLKGGVKATASQLIKDHEGDLYPSDHFFLKADLVFE